MVHQYQLLWGYSSKQSAGYKPEIRFSAPGSPTRKKNAMQTLVLVKDPDVTSHAALVLLRRKLREEERGGLMDWQVWLRFREQYLAEQLFEHGDLVCAYCGQVGLQVSVGEHPASEMMKMLATVDHVYPRGKGGAEYDRKNLCVACYPCNNLKADKLDFKPVDN